MCLLSCGNCGNSYSGNFFTQAGAGAEPWCGVGVERSRKWLQAPGSAEGGSVITDSESVDEHRGITGTSRCMQGNFSPALGGGGFKAE